MTKKRWPPDPLRVVIATAIALLIGAVVLVGLADPVADTEEAELAAAAAAAAAEARTTRALEPATNVAAAATTKEPVAAPKAPRTKKGKLLQQKLEERRAKLAAVDKTGRPRVSLRAGGSEAALVERVLKRKLDAAFVDDAGASYALTLRVDRKPGAGVQLKCSVAVAAMPGKNLVASFSSQAGVEGDADDAELLSDAAQACADALAEDLGPWLRRSK